MRRLSYEEINGDRNGDINGDRNANGDKNDVKSGAQHQEAVQDVKYGAKRQAGAQRQDITQACAAFEHKACAD